VATLGAFAIIRNLSGRILCVRQAYAPMNWTTPGGRVNPDESPVQTVVREVLEETGFVVTAQQLIGIYEKRYCSDTVLSFLCDVVDDVRWAPTEEIASKGFFSPEALPTPMAYNTLLRIRDAVEGRWGIIRILEQPDRVTVPPRVADVASTTHRTDT
jgi:8-oxo-dGTP diphosphatase